MNDFEREIYDFLRTELVEIDESNEEAVSFLEEKAKKLAAKIAPF